MSPKLKSHQNFGNPCNLPGSFAIYGVLWRSLAIFADIWGLDFSCTWLKLSYIWLDVITIMMLMMNQMGRPFWQRGLYSFVLWLEKWLNRMQMAVLGEITKMTELNGFSNWLDNGRKWLSRNGWKWIEITGYFWK